MAASDKKLAEVEANKLFAELIDKLGNEKATQLFTGAIIPIDLGERVIEMHQPKSNEPIGAPPRGGSSINQGKQDTISGNELFDLCVDTKAQRIATAAKQLHEELVEQFSDESGNTSLADQLLIAAMPAIYAELTRPMFIAHGLEEFEPLSSKSLAETAKQWLAERRLRKLEP